MNHYKSLLLALPGIQAARFLRASLESRWFDWRHQIETTGDVQPDEMQVAGSNGLYGRKYSPTSLRAGRRVFEDLPIDDFSQYTFVDFGSGKGRMLFLAAEYPFRRVLGAEYATNLHNLAERNIRCYTNSRQRCFDLASVNVDAAQFEFPRGNTVAYFFSPFDRPVMEPLIERLDASIATDPRDVLVVYLNPELGELVERTRHFRVVVQTPYYSIYRGYQGAAPSPRIHTGETARR